MIKLIPCDGDGDENGGGGDGDGDIRRCSRWKGQMKERKRSGVQLEDIYLFFF